MTEIREILEEFAEEYKASERLAYQSCKKWHDEEDRLIDQAEAKINDLIKQAVYKQIKNDAEICWNSWNDNHHVCNQKEQSHRLARCIESQLKDVE